MTYVIRLISALLCCFLLAACGQSGPLTLPDQSPPPAASPDGEPVPEVIPDAIPEAVPDPAEVPDDESI